MAARATGVSPAASVQQHKNSKNVQMEEGLKHEQKLAQAAVDKFDTSTPTALKTRALIADALDALAPAEEQRAAGATALAEAAGKLHAQSLEALDAQAHGLALMRLQLVEQYGFSKEQWQNRYVMLHHTSAHLHITHLLHHTSQSQLVLWVARAGGYTTLREEAKKGKMGIFEKNVC